MVYEYSSAIIGCGDVPAHVPHSRMDGGSATLGLLRRGWIGPPEIGDYFR